MIVAELQRLRDRTATGRLRLQAQRSVRAGLAQLIVVRRPDTMGADGVPARDPIAGLPEGLGAIVDWLTATPYVAMIALVLVNAWIVSRIDIDVRPDE